LQYNTSQPDFFSPVHYSHQQSNQSACNVAWW